MTAGDCVYIPCNLIHQVRSYDRNIAVNVWWDHLATLDIDPDQCEVKEIVVVVVVVFVVVQLS